MTVGLEHPTPRTREGRGTAGKEIRRRCASRDACVQKIKGQITSPPVLNMHSYVTAPAGAGYNVYRRVAIVEHRNGHYTAYVTRDAASFLCDGSRVTLVSEAEMNSCQDAYLFVYARVAPDEHAVV